jgi:CheY-like chemotaxis protein
MENRKTLVVDDESDRQIYVSTIVETMGFEPTVAANGAEALEKARAIPPALVILDVMMPAWKNPPTPLSSSVSSACGGRVLLRRIKVKFPAPWGV